MQLKFSILELAGMLVLLASLWLAWRLIVRLPNREPQPAVAGLIRLTPVTLDQDRFTGARLVGAWRLTGSDPRLGGLSALAWSDGGLIALSDSGAVIRFALPRRGRGARAWIADIPDGPGSPRWKKNRDSEALGRDPTGGWWVSFEIRHQLWRFDETFGHATSRVRLGAERWPPNRGIEALVISDDRSLLLLPEQGRSLIRLAGGRMASAPVESGGSWRVADAALLADGRLLVLRRRFTPLGLRSSVAELVRAGEGYRYRRPIALGLGPLDNAEGMAAQSLPDGRVRLWLVTDNDFRWKMRTLLVALDLPRSSKR